MFDFLFFFFFFFFFLKKKIYIFRNLFRNEFIKGYIPNMPKLATCDFTATKLCKFESSPCTTNLSKDSMCTKEDVKTSNKANYNPKPDDDKYEKLLLTKKGKITRIVILVIVVSIVAFIIYKKLKKCHHKK